MKTPLSFQQATDELQRFLANQQRPLTIQWVFRDDLLFFRRNVFLRWPLPNDNWQSAASLYEVGREKGLGLALVAHCFDQCNAYCHLLIPEDEVDASYLMMTELKLQVMTSAPRVWKIRTSWLWQIAQEATAERDDPRVPDTEP